jgi:dihydroorotase-like cyclic amidohydrolase
VTTIIEHTHAAPVRTVADLNEKRSYLDGRSNVDFGLAAHVWPYETGELEAMWVEGIAYFKLFTCTTHGVPGLDAAGLEDAFSRIAAFGGACLVHCEDESLTLRAEEELRGQDRDDGGLLIEWRSRQAEEVAVAVAGVLAARTGVKATVAHVSSPSVGRAAAVRMSRPRRAPSTSPCVRTMFGRRARFGSSHLRRASRPTRRRPRCGGCCVPAS